MKVQFQGGTFTVGGRTFAIGKGTMAVEVPSRPQRPARVKLPRPPRPTAYDPKVRATADGKGVEFYLPIETRSRTNARVHRMVQARQTKAERNAVAAIWTTYIRGALPPGPFDVALVRHYSDESRRMDSHDNLCEALKAVADEIALQLGFKSDRHPSLRFFQSQERRREPGVTVQIVTRG